MDLFERETTWGGIRQIEAWHVAFGQTLSQRTDIQNVAQLGTILRFEVAEEGGGTYFTTLRDRMYTALLAQGVLLRPLGNVLFINPPYCLKEEEYHKLAQAILHMLDGLSAPSDQ
jgi:adenosylmethionine-8-amino-7-oxononanoate aminotransferase